MINSQHDFFGKQLAMTHHKLFHLFTKIFQKEGLDLTFEQSILLRIINDNEGVSQQELSILMNKDKTSITRAINILENHHKVVRISSKEDKRKKVIYLTKEGREHIKAIIPVFKRVKNEVEACLNTKELDLLSSIMGKINEQIEKIEKTL